MRYRVKIHVRRRLPAVRFSAEKFRAPEINGVIILRNTEGLGIVPVFVVRLLLALAGGFRRPLLHTVSTGF